jgi:hypothetical protein
MFKFNKILFSKLSILPILALFISSANAENIPTTSTQIHKFKGKQVGQKVGELIWRGGIEISSEVEKFGGLSGITFTGENQKFVIVSDIGNFFSGRLIYDENSQPLNLQNLTASAITNSKGAVLPRKFAKDAEAIDVIYREGKYAAIRVGFENLTRVADFELRNAMPIGAAKQIAIPQSLTKERTNTSLEALCIAPPASPIAGSTLLITEDMADGNNIAAFMLGKKDKGRFSIKRARGLNPTDCAFLENGDLLILERGTGFLSFKMQLRLVASNEVRPAAKLKGKVILKASGGDIDNMEGLAIHKDKNGIERITIISDDNFNTWERTLLLEFSLE